jgi:hypothetical protein
MYNPIDLLNMMQALWLCIDLGTHEASVMVCIYTTREERPEILHV